jgi:RNA polymerase sigma factor (sigma-70 family)
MTLGDIPDADGFASSIADAWVRRNNIVRSEVELEEVYAEARLALWTAFQRWNPERGVALRSYAAWKTSALLTDWIRVQRGRTYGGDRTSLKPHATAVSLDIPADGERDTGSSRLDGIISQSARDPSTDRAPDLSRTLELGSRGLPREERGVRGTTYARAS